MEEFLTIDEAAHVLKIAPRTLAGWIRAGKIRAVKVGRFWRIPTSAIDEVAKSGTKTPAKGGSLLDELPENGHGKRLTRALNELKETGKNKKGTREMGGGA